ncbi:MAG: Glutamine amidotransferase class-I domain protein [Thermoanaerobacterales bacterium 50_218]|nr:MAG: Glutamine amidotransferase class-I domain protein [Thermoanaerobacterales bacterium 50_218]
MGSRPIIGITLAHDPEKGRFFCREAYLDAVQRAGGVPVLLPPVQKQDSLQVYRDLVAGLLLSGGGDLHPSFFGEDPCWKLGEVSLVRDKFEIALVKLVLDAGKPVLGICRGIQVLNVALGGTLYQDLSSQAPASLQHIQRGARKEPAHEVEIKKGSLLASVLGAERIWVNSFHHQAVKDVAPSLEAVAWSADGVVEAVELPGHDFVVGVQWHPEDLLEEEHAVALFRAFVAAAEQ